MRKLLAILLLVSGGTLGATDFLTEGVDNGRTGWVKDEKIFTTANVGSTKLLWKVKLESAPRAMHNLYAPLIAESVTTAQGNREIGLAAGVSDDLFALDVTTGAVIWRRQFENRLATQAPVNNTLCPGGQTAVPTMVQRAPGQYTVYAVSWDGKLHQINLADGENVAPAEKFIPGNGKPYALNYKDGVIYTATAQGCGGVTNAFYSFDLATRRASAFIPAGGGLWGRRGASIDPEGRVYLGTGDAQFDPATRRLGNGIVSVKLDANKTLQLVDYFGAPNANWLWRRDLDVNTTPVALDYRGRKFLVGTSKECRLWLLDRDNLGGEDHRTSLYTTPLVCADSQAFDAVGVWGALSAWQDAAGTQWVLVPFWGPVSKQFKAPVEHSRPKGGGVAAFKLEEVAGKWQLTPAWLSRDMDLARRGRDRQRRGVRVRRRRGRDTDRAGRRVERARWSPVRRRPGQRTGSPDPQLAQSGALRPRRTDGPGTLVQRQRDHLVESFQRNLGGQRSRVYRDVGRDALLLRHRPVGGGLQCVFNEVSQ